MGMAGHHVREEADYAIIWLGPPNNVFQLTDVQQETRSMNCTFCGRPPEVTGTLVGAQQNLLDGFVMTVGICNSCVDSVLTCIAQDNQANAQSAEDAGSQELLYCSFCGKNHKQVAKMITGGRFYRHEYQPGKMNYYTFSHGMAFQLESADKKLDFMGQLLICDECASVARDIFQGQAQPQS